MKKITILFCMFLSLTLGTTSAVADLLVVDTDPPDLNPSYWTGSDVNPATNLNNSNPTTEEAWLEALLGKTYNDSSVNLALNIQNPEGGAQELTNYNPGTAWEYAVVKYGSNWAAYQDTGNDNLLSTGPLGNGVSHITFFEGPGNGNGNGNGKVPEPATLLLLGCGLIGLATFGRRKFKK